VFATQKRYATTLNRLIIKHYSIELVAKFDVIIAVSGRQFCPIWVLRARKNMQKPDGNGKIRLKSA